MPDDLSPAERRRLHSTLEQPMSKAFIREGADGAGSEDDGEDDGVGAPPIPPGSKNYMTPQGHRRLKDELLHLLKVERPEVVRTVSWAASNGDRSENGDYIYGKKRLREIDRRIRFLTKRLDAAEVVDPAAREATDQVFFGATVTYLDQGPRRRHGAVAHAGGGGIVGNCRCAVLAAGVGRCMEGAPCAGGRRGVPRAGWQCAGRMRLQGRGGLKLSPVVACRRRPSKHLTRLRSALRAVNRPPPTARRQPAASQPGVEGPRSARPRDGARNACHDQARGLNYMFG